MLHLDDDCQATFRRIRVARFAIAMIALCGLCTRVEAQDLVELEEQAIRAAVAKVAPSLVRIETIGGLEQVGDVLLGEGPTTGLIVSSDGFIISSAFNFARLPTSILVVLPGNRRVPAQIVSRDESRMVVLLKINAPEALTVPDAVPPGDVTVGQRAIALGRALSPDQPNVSVGIISAKQRMFGKAIQTDAKISPSNYGGPLIDLQGRVFGVLVPISAEGQNELAGAEWYDGGIGFAVPLDEINKRLDRMKRENLQPGVLGVTLKPGDMYSLPAEIIATHPKSPVYQAGIRAGDKIVECNGKPVERQVQLKHILGPLYAGEKVQLVTMRGDQRRELSIELAGKLTPYEHPFLGILPGRTDPADKKEVTIRYVYPSSPADKAGLKTGDRIVELGGKPAGNATELRNHVASFEPGGKVPVRFSRGEESKTAEIELGTLPNELPVPEAAAREKSDAATKPGEPSVVEVDIPEEPNDCVALLPASYQREKSYGLIVFLPPPGEFNKESFVKRWQSIADKFDLIVLAPQATLPNMWLPTEVGFVRKSIDHAIATYSIDRTRVVTYGFQASGAMAFLTAFRHRDLVRAVVTIDTGVSSLSRPPDNDPVDRLAILLVVADKSGLAARIKGTTKALRDLKFPVVVLQQEGEPRDLSDEELVKVVSWVDTLDRI